MAPSKAENDVAGSMKHLGMLMLWRAFLESGLCFFLFSSFCLAVSGAFSGNPHKNIT
jgi:hypothetical protein